MRRTNNCRRSIKRYCSCGNVCIIPYEQHKSTVTTQYLQMQFPYNCLGLTEAFPEVDVSTAADTTATNTAIATDTDTDSEADPSLYQSMMAVYNHSQGECSRHESTLQGPAMSPISAVEMTEAEESTSRAGTHSMYCTIHAHIIKIFKQHT